MPGVFPVALVGIHVWHMPALIEIFGDDSILQFGGGTLGPWGNAPDVVANRVALEACVQARNKGRDLTCEGSNSKSKEKVANYVNAKSIKDSNYYGNTRNKEAFIYDIPKLAIRLPFQTAVPAPPPPSLEEVEAKKIVESWMSRELETFSPAEDFSELKIMLHFLNYKGRINQMFFEDITNRVKDLRESLCLLPSTTTRASTSHPTAERTEAYDPVELNSCGQKIAKVKLDRQLAILEEVLDQIGQKAKHLRAQIKHHKLAKRKLSGSIDRMNTK
ncbi:hypothetical protein C1H46_015479 [Malus baccata]|uniref:Ribulose bisphosphate carboxylase large subunit C-terminal domain-containing protein n=1 Tax=Malus baccata TaxID=106549 RepID=A0A540MJ64_MALBA|nr:hypothetical protein C1H46_015479 [Malus baccata]